MRMEAAAHWRRMSGRTWPVNDRPAVAMIGCPGYDAVMTFASYANKSRLRAAVAALAATLTIWGAAGARAEDSARSAANTASGVAAKVGKAIERGAKAAANGVERGVNAAASGVQRGAKATANGIERGAKATGNALDGAAQTVGISPPATSTSGK